MNKKILKNKKVLEIFYKIGINTAIHELIYGKNSNVESKENSEAIKELIEELKDLTDKFRI